MSNGCCGWFPPPPPPGMDDKNRFGPENRFVGDIEDGKRYPYGVYTKAEADARFVNKNEIPTLDLGLSVENGMLCITYESEG